MKEFQEKNADFKRKQKEQLDSHYGAKELPTIPDDSEVWITLEDKTISGRVVITAETPRSYMVETDSGELQRNRSQQIVAPETEQDSTPETVAEPPHLIESTAPPKRIMTRSGMGINIQPPERLA